MADMFDHSSIFMAISIDLNIVKTEWHMKKHNEIT